MNRREFLKRNGLVLASALSSREILAAPRPRLIQTVRGAMEASRLGRTLMHEHVLVDFVGADKVSRDRYDPDEVFRIALPHLERARSLGCKTLVECTPAYIGRDPILLRRLSEASGLNIVTNTGYYGAAADKCIPPHAYRETADQLAARWSKEYDQGIEGTRGIEDSPIRPGLIKTGLDAGPLSEIDAKLVRAAARTHLKTGLAVAAHSGDGTAALEALALWKEEGAPAWAFIWVHAQNESDTGKHLQAAREGAWVEFDGIREKSVPRHLEFVKNIKAHALLDRTLVSQDSGWYHVGDPGGGDYRAYLTLFTRFIPAAREAGLTESDLEMLVVANPHNALLALPPLRLTAPSQAPQVL